MTCNTELLNVTTCSSWNECIEFEFAIDNFSSLRKVKKGSLQLMASHECKTSWRIVFETLASGIHSPKKCSNATNAMRVGLRRSDFNKWDVKASLFFAILNSYKELYWKESIEKIFPQGQFIDFYCDCIKRPGNNLITKGMYGHDFFFDDDKLIITGNILIQDCCPRKITNNGCDSVMNIMDLQSSFKNSYQNNLFSDVVFILGNDKIHAHRMVLCARSPVFKKMFELNMKETNFNSVEITDIEKSVFDVFLIFLYTGEVENTEFDTVMSLYSTADKYEVTTLFKTCSNILVSYISDKTAPAILKLADMHGDKALNEKAVKFICDNFIKIEGTCEWNNLLDTDPRLASYTLKMVSSNVAAKKI